MGTRASFAALALVCVACSSEGGAPPGYESLYLMNMTHDLHELSRYRARKLDCVAAAREPSGTLKSADFEFERCVTVGPGTITGLDREEDPDVPLACDAVALEAPGLAPHALFWTDTGYDYWRRRTREEVLVTLVSVGELLLLEPSTKTILAPLDALPENACNWGH